MSLRGRILLFVVAVNLLVTAVLFVILDRDLRRRRQAQDLQLLEQRAENWRTVRAAFGGSLILDAPPSGERQAATIIRHFQRHPINQLVEDFVILNETALEKLLSDQVLPDDAVYLNKGGKTRKVERAEALPRIREALRRGEPVYDERGRWIAAPIERSEQPEPDAAEELREAIDRVNRALAQGVEILEGPDRSIEGPLQRDEADEATPAGGPLGSPPQSWGGGYFVLPGAVPDPVASFESRTLLLVMGCGTLVLVSLTWLLLDRWVLRPVVALSRGATRVAERSFDVPVPGGGGGDELGRLVESFNTMMREVEDAQVNLERRVEEATRRAQESRRGLVIAQRLAATGTLASGIAHEINNPLGGMLNAVRTLRRQEEQGSTVDPRRLRYLALLDDGLQRIQEITRRVLQFSPRRMEPRESGMLEIVARATALSEHRARQVDVEIVVRGSDQQVLVEPGEMQQVLLNLLLNSCDALEGRGGRVEVELTRDGDQVVVQVRDSGPGMTGEERERAFDLFFTTKEAGRGTGLGLSVAHHIVEQHGGTLTVESEPDSGCEFTVRLPAVAGA